MINPANSRRTEELRGHVVIRMTPHRRSCDVRRPLLLLAVAAALVGCSANHSAAPVSSPGATPKPTPSVAVTTLLRAEAAGDHDTSFRLLDATARKDYKDVADWKRRRSELS